MAYPVSLAEGARQLRLQPDELTDARSEEISGFIADACGWVERYTGHILEARDVTEEFSGFGALELMAWPIAADAVPVMTYDAGAEEPVTIQGARLALHRRPVRVLCPLGSHWPNYHLAPKVTVTIRAGYEPTDELPGNLRRAILILVGAYDADREGGDMVAKAEETARRLCRDFRLRRV